MKVDSRALNRPLVVIVIVMVIIAAGAAYWFLRGPIISLVDVKEIDRNGDGLIDQFNISLTNLGGTEGRLVTFSGLTDFQVVTREKTVPAGETVVLVMKTFTADKQLDPDESYEFTLDFDPGDNKISITASSEEISEKVVSLEDRNAADGWIKDVQYWVRNPLSNSELTSPSDGNATHSGTPGMRFTLLTNGTARFWRDKNSDNASLPGYNNNPLSDSPETANVTEKSILIFWIKSNQNESSSNHYWIRFNTYSSGTYKSEVEVELTGTNPIVESGKWQRIIIDLKEVVTSAYYETFGTTIAFFGIKMRNNSGLPWSLDVDDVGIFPALD